MLQVPASWQTSCALQTTGFAPVHVPAWQVSVCEHALPSLQAAPLALFGLLQTPVPVLQVPASWHWSLASQTTGLAPVHVPAWQVSACVQALPSLQAAPLALFGLLQTPLPVLQVPASWHWSLASQTIGLAPVHVPAWQVSVCEHALPSLQAAPLALFGLLHTPLPVLQVPAS